MAGENFFLPPLEFNIAETKSTPVEAERLDFKGAAQWRSRTHVAHGECGYDNL
jgi:hypothetical protein